jgi:hypothetical protein
MEGRTARRLSEIGLVLAAGCVILERFALDDWGDPACWPGLACWYGPGRRAGERPAPSWSTGSEMERPCGTPGSAFAQPSSVGSRDRRLDLRIPPSAGRPGSSSPCRPPMGATHRIRPGRRRRPSGVTGASAPPDAVTSARPTGWETAAATEAVVGSRPDARAWSAGGVHRDLCRPQRLVGRAEVVAPHLLASEPQTAEPARGQLAVGGGWGRSESRSVGRDLVPGAGFGPAKPALCDLVAVATTKRAGGSRAVRLPPA